MRWALTECPATAWNPEDSGARAGPPGVAVPTPSEGPVLACGTWGWVSEPAGSSLLHLMDRVAPVAQGRCVCNCHS